MTQETSHVQSSRRSGGKLADPTLVAIRQAFYQGLARKCLREAWFQLDQFREKQKSWRLFRGKNQWREGVPLQDVATQLGRDVGVVARWFRGESPEWANLLIAMTVLDAGWDNLASLPSKEDRRSAGNGQALVYVRKVILGENPEQETEPPTRRELADLEMMFATECWPVDRRLPRRRSTTLEQIAAQSQVDWARLDSVDRLWGDAWIWCLKAYSDSIDPEIWR